MLNGFFHDLKFAIRLWTKNWMVLAISLFILSAGLGVSTAVFSIVHAVLIKPLPFSDPDRIVTFERERPRGKTTAISPLLFQDLTTRTEAFESTSAFTSEVMNLTGVGEPRRLRGMVVSWNFFDTLKVAPYSGRPFSKSEGILGAHRVVWLGYNLWKSAFAADQSVLGRVIQIEGRSYTVVGIAPPEFEYPDQTEIWRPLVFAPEDLDPSQRGASWVEAVARLKSNVEIEEARSRVDTLAQQLERDFPRTNTDVKIHVHSLSSFLVRNTQKPLWIVLAAVVLVVLLSCANVTNLLLAQLTRRTSEFNIRAALGASRSRLIRQFLLESVVISIPAGILGYGIATLCLEALPFFGPQDLPRLEQVAMNLPVLLFLSGSVLLTSILTGLFPALQSRNLVANSARIVEGGSQRVRRALVIGEIAIALVMLTSAGLLLRSVHELLLVPSGFNPKNVFTFELSLPDSRYSEPAKVQNFLDRMTAEVRRVPQTKNAAVVFGLPMSTGPSAWSSFEIMGVPASEEMTAGLRVVSGSYFETMQIPLLKGRPFDARDRADTAPVLIISESLANKYFPGKNPIGLKIRPHVSITTKESQPSEIIGIIGDVHYNGLDQDSTAEMYLPLAQQTVSWAEIVVRSEGSASQLQGALRQIITSLDPSMPVPPVRPMQEVIDITIAKRRFVTTLLSVFSGIATLLAGIGIYGILSFSVAQRTREIGLRMALGAQKKSIFNLIIKNGMGLILTGGVIGCLLALSGTRILKHLLYSVTPTDFWTYAAGFATLLVIGIAATYLPARRALNVQPMEALRHE